MLNEILGSVTLIIAFLGVFVEITPIKINPISSLLKYCGSKLNEDLRNDIKDMKSDIEILVDNDIEHIQPDDDLFDL